MTRNKTRRMTIRVIESLPGPAANQNSTDYHPGCPTLDRLTPRHVLTLIGRPVSTYGATSAKTVVDFPCNRAFQDTPQIPINIFYSNPRRLSWQEKHRKNSNQEGLSSQSISAGYCWKHCDSCSTNIRRGFMIQFILLLVLLQLCWLCATIDCVFAYAIIIFVMFKFAGLMRS